MIKHRIRVLGQFLGTLLVRGDVKTQAIAIATIGEHLQKVTTFLNEM